MWNHQQVLRHSYEIPAQQGAVLAYTMGVNEIPAHQGL